MASEAWAYPSRGHGTVTGNATKHEQWGCIGSPPMKLPANRQRPRTAGSDFQAWKESGGSTPRTMTPSRPGSAPYEDLARRTMRADTTQRFDTAHYLRPDRYTILGAQKSIRFRSCAEPQPVRRTGHSIRDAQLQQAQLTMKLKREYPTLLAKFQEADFHSRGGNTGRKGFLPRWYVLSEVSALTRPPCSLPLDEAQVAQIAKRATARDGSSLDATARPTGDGMIEYTTFLRLLRQSKPALSNVLPPPAPPTARVQERAMRVTTHRLLSPARTTRVMAHEMKHPVTRGSLGLSQMGYASTGAGLGGGGAGFADMLAATYMGDGGGGAVAAPGPRAIGVRTGALMGWQDVEP